MTVIHRCAWCPSEPVASGVIVSHGICAACEAKYFPHPTQDDVKRLADNQPFEPRGGTYYGQGY